MATPFHDLPETSLEEFLYAIFFNLIAEGTDKAFESGQFDCQTEEFRALFEYEFGIFCFWTVAFFAKHRDEFVSYEDLSETICRALVRTLQDALEVSDDELERLYGKAIERFEEMDADMLSQSGLSNLAVGVAARVCEDRRGEDFFKCLALTNNSFSVLIRRHAQALESVRIV